MTKFSDIDFNFTRNPITNDVSILIDDAAIKASLRNLILTDMGERPFNSKLGSSIRSLLFEPASPIIASELESRIRNVIRNYEPRVVLLRVEVTLDNDANSFNALIGFRLRDDNRPLVVPVSLKRLR